MAACMYVALSTHVSFSQKTDNILCKDKGFIEGVSKLLGAPDLWAHKAYLRCVHVYMAACMHVDKCVSVC